MTYTDAYELNSAGRTRDTVYNNEDNVAERFVEQKMADG